MDGYTFYDYWYIIYRKRWTIILVTILSAVFAAFLSLFFLPKVYQAGSVFFVPAKQDFLTFYSGESSRQITRVPLLPESRGEQQKIYLGILSSESLRKRVHQAFPAKPLARLKRDVDFRAGTDFLIKVYVRDHDPVLAAGIANLYVDLFNKALNEYSFRTAAEHKRTLERQLEDIKASLVRARSELSSFKAKHRMTSADSYGADLSRSAVEMRKAIEEERVKIRELGVKAGALEKEYSREAKSYSAGSIETASPMEEHLKKELAQIEGQMARLRATLTEKHPEVAALKSQYELAKGRLSEEIDRIIKSEMKSHTSFVEVLRRDLIQVLIEKASREARARGLEDVLSSIEADLSQAPELQSRYQELEQGVVQYQKLMDSLTVSIAMPSTGWRGRG